MSMHPVWAREILTGRKSVEVRRRPPAADAGTLIVIYATAPVRAVVGVATLTAVHRADPEILWRELGSRTALSRESFSAYLAGASDPGALELSSVRATAPLALGLRAPQSWLWLREDRPDHAALAARLQATIDVRHACES